MGEYAMKIHVMCWWNWWFDDFFTELIVSETGWNAPTTWDVSVMIGDDFTHVPDCTFYNIL